MWTDSPLLRDAGAAMLTGVAAAVVLRFWEEVANRALLEQVTPPHPLCLPLASPSAHLLYNNSVTRTFSFLEDIT